MNLELDLYEIFHNFESRFVNSITDPQNKYIVQCIIGLIING